MKEKDIVDILFKEGIGVLPTDTIYGLVGSALSKKAVAKIYKIRKRDFKKPFIILISSLNDLRKFNIKINIKTRKILKKLWPDKVSVILQCPHKKFTYLHRGTKSLAFRLPVKKSLIKLLKKTGPLVAPSVNPEGLVPAKNIKEAKKYFSNKAYPIRNKFSRGNNKHKSISDGVDFYITAGKLESKPSTLIKIKNGKIIVLRQGVINIHDKSY